MVHMRSTVPDGAEHYRDRQRGRHQDHQPSTSLIRLVDMVLPSSGLSGIDLGCLSLPREL